jgi:hypothetical protein
MDRPRAARCAGFVGTGALPLQLLERSENESFKGIIGNHGNIATWLPLHQSQIIDETLM